MRKITKIQIKVPKETPIPDGIYLGTWGDYCIESTINGKTYELTTEDGIATFQEVNN